MLRKISLVFLLSTLILSCNKNDMNPIDAVDKSTPKGVSKTKSFDSKASTGFPYVYTGCSSDPTLTKAQSWYIPTSEQAETYATGGVIAGSQYIIRTERLPTSRDLTLGIIRLIDSSKSYLIRNIELSVNNNGTINPGIYYSNVPDSFIVSFGASSVYNGTLTSFGSLYENYSPNFTGTNWSEGGAYPPSDWFIKINSCSVSFEGCKRKININYELYVKDYAGQFRQLFPSSFIGLSVD